MGNPFSKRKKKLKRAKSQDSTQSFTFLPTHNPRDTPDFDTYVATANHRLTLNGQSSESTDPWQVRRNLTRRGSSLTHIDVIRNGRIENEEHDLIFRLNNHLRPRDEPYHSRQYNNPQSRVTGRNTLVDPQVRESDSREIDRHFLHSVIVDASQNATQNNDIASNELRRENLLFDNDNIVPRRFETDNSDGQPMPPIHQLPTTRNNSQPRNCGVSNLLESDHPLFQRQSYTSDESFNIDADHISQQEDLQRMADFLSHSSSLISLSSEDDAQFQIIRPTLLPLPRSQSVPDFRIPLAFNDGDELNFASIVPSDADDNIPIQSTHRENNNATESDLMQYLTRPRALPPNTAQFNVDEDADISERDSETSIPILRRLMRQHLREHPEEDMRPPRLEALLSNEPLEVLSRRRRFFLEPFGFTLGAGDHLFNFLDHGFAARQVNVEKLPTKKFSKEAVSTQQMCHICLEHYDTGDELKTLTCFHDFHTACIEKWLETYPTCPVCRTTVNTEDGL